VAADSEGSLKLIAGLGNPGARYAGTRHNLGFMAVDLFARRAARCTDWQERFGALIAKAAPAGGDEVLLVKPLTYMNRSGAALGEAAGFYKIAPPQIAVVHDDLDLPFGTLRISRGCGDGGHRGVRSVSEALGSADYIRVRCGIGRPAADGAGVVDPAEWVLEPFSVEERPRLDIFLEVAASALESLKCEGLSAAQNKFNREV